ncbi:disease resistance protein RPM1-like [Eucalyptus grandis]|uniref:disease resistance protein RPM1-like n=1 Tax=Eucalyptus grandis TaxID=71139 RepID=UPI00192E8F7E|nr:disease resistance protein RPM1-like [Eucalyptus grandis]XP_039168237.1 disease resistance protein RPM1-like [Eucalyptus grandis]
MADFAVNCLLAKLKDFLENGVLLGGAEEEATLVKRQLEYVWAFLRSADSLEESDEEVKVWVKHLREIAYDTEDALDEFKLLLAHDHGIGIPGLLSKLSCCIKNMKGRYRIASEMKSINARIKSIFDGHWRVRDKLNKVEHRYGSSKPDDTWQDQRGNALLLDKAELVGISEPTKRLVGWLIEGASTRHLISVVGMGGLGKTTLVKQVYEDPEVKKHFIVRAWITLSQSPNIEEILQGMFRQIMRETEEPVPPLEDNKDRLCQKMIIKDLLQKARYLIVVDDAWRINDWDAIKHALPNNICGSRIIITSRNSDLAHTSCAEFRGMVYKMEPLSDEQSWKLFRAKTFQGNLCPPHLEETCGLILRKCEGLPLAIVTIAGVLVLKDTRKKDEWDLVLRSLFTEINCNDKFKTLKRVLSLSFDDLPYYLKSCFLHLSVFPKGYIIDCGTIFRLWIAEGFVDKKGGMTVEEVAQEHFSELLNRSLIEVAVTTYDGRMKFCRIHDLLVDIITSKSSNQGFAETAIEKQPNWPDKVRRLSIQNSPQAIQQKRSLSQLRSLHMFGAERSSMDAVLGSEMRLLTVLDLQAAPLTRFPAKLAEWRCLRYLSFRYTKVRTVPNSIGNLQNLETLDLKHTYVTELPVAILKLGRLRHLLVYRYSDTPYSWCKYSWCKYGFKSPGEIGSLQSLQKLCSIEAGGGRNSSLMREIGKLKQLNRLAIFNLRREDARELCSSIEKLTKLQAISVTSVNENEIIDLQQLSAPPPFLQRIYLTGRLEALPRWISYLDSLMVLRLKCSQLKDNPLSSLGNLPNLVHLHLIRAYEGTKLRFNANNFLKLQFLGLVCFDKLKCVEVEKGSMSCLEKLIIANCKLMEELPSGVEHLEKLTVLQFIDMSDEFVKKLKRDGQDDDCYLKVAQFPEVYYGYRRCGGWDALLTKTLCERSVEFPPCSK